VVITPRREAILRHTARYGVTLRPVLERLFYADSDRGCESDLSELRKAKLLHVVKNAIPDPKNQKTKYSYYYLSRQAAVELGVPASRANQPGPAALARNLSILWYCCMREVRSHLLEDAELEELLADPDAGKPTGGEKNVPKGYYCVSSVDKCRLLSIYKTSTTVPDILTELRKRISQARKVPAIDSAIKHRQLAFLVLVESRSLQDEVWGHAKEMCKTLKTKILVTRSPGSWRE